MVFGHIKLIVQRVRCAPSPACSYLVGSLVSGAEAVLVGLIGIIDRQEATPGPRAGVVVDLSAVDEVLDGLNLDIGVGIKVLADALVVAALAVDQLIDGVEGERVVVLPAFCTRSLDVVPVEVVAVLVIDGHARVSTHHGGESVAVLVANLNTLGLLVAVVDVLANLDDVETLVGAVDDMVRVDTEGEAAIVGLDHIAEDTVLVLITCTDGELAAVGAAGDVERVACCHGVLVANGLDPVRSRIAAVLIRL